jgi:hypothetical protein
MDNPLPDTCHSVGQCLKAEIESEADHPPYETDIENLTLLSIGEEDSDFRDLHTANHNPACSSQQSSLFDHDIADRGLIYFVLDSDYPGWVSYLDDTAFDGGRTDEGIVTLTWSRRMISIGFMIRHSALQLSIR